MAKPRISTSTGVLDRGLGVHGLLSDHEDGWKELRVRIEPGHYQKLLALKILGQKTMTLAIHEALQHYFLDVLPDAIRAGEPARRRREEDDPVASAE